MNQNQDDVHAGHCCAQHGCKYGDPDCPVFNHRVEQKYSCDSCMTVEDAQSYIDYYTERYTAELEWAKKLTARGIRI